MGIKVRVNKKKLYLDIYQDGKRTWENLHLTLTSDKEQNKEIMRLADVCRSKRETQLLTGLWGIQDSDASKEKLIDYLEALAKEKKHDSYIRGCIRYLKKIQSRQYTAYTYNG